MDVRMAWRVMNKASRRTVGTYGQGEEKAGGPQGRRKGRDKKNRLG